MKADSMRCASCGRTKQYPDGFPSAHFAECWPCAWDNHIHQSHPRVVRRVRREARRRARKRAEWEEYDAMYEREQRQVLGVETETSNEGDE